MDCVNNVLVVHKKGIYKNEIDAVYDPATMVSDTVIVVEFTNSLMVVVYFNTDDWYNLIVFPVISH